MVKLFTAQYTFQHDFATVTNAFWRKYPNPLSPHVKEVECLDREITPEGHLVTRRLLACEQSVPSWMRALCDSPLGYIAETTTVDATEQKMIIRSRNLTGASVMIVDETCTYERHPSNPSWTTYEQKAEITAFMPIISSKFENYSFSNMRDKSKFGAAAIESLCQKIAEGGWQSTFTNLISSNESAPAPSSSSSL